MAPESPSSLRLRGRPIVAQSRQRQCWEQTHRLGEGQSSKTVGSAYGPPFFSLFSLPGKRCNLFYTVPKLWDSDINRPSAMLERHLANSTNTCARLTLQTLAPDYPASPGSSCVADTLPVQLSPPPSVFSSGQFTATVSSPWTACLMLPPAPLQPPFPLVPRWAPASPGDCRAKARSLARSACGLGPREHTAVRLSSHDSRSRAAQLRATGQVSCKD